MFQDSNNDEKEEDLVVYPPPPLFMRVDNVARREENARLAGQPNIPENVEPQDPDLNDRQIAGKKSKPKSKYVPDNMCTYSGESVPCPEEMLIKNAKAREAYRKKKALQGKKSPRKSPARKRSARKSPKEEVTT